MTVYERGSFKINRADDREELIKILANAGYIVKIEQRENWPNLSDYYVVVYAEDYKYTNE